MAVRTEYLLSKNRAVLRTFTNVKHMQKMSLTKNIMQRNRIALITYLTCLELHRRIPQPLVPQEEHSISYHLGTDIDLSWQEERYLKEDSCPPAFSYQTVETVVPKDWNCLKSHCWRKMLEPWRPAKGGACWLWRTDVNLDDGQWWMRPHFDQEWLVMPTCCLLVKPKPYISTTKMDSGLCLRLVTTGPILVILNKSAFSAIYHYLSFRVLKEGKPRSRIWP